MLDISITSLNNSFVASLSAIPESLKKPSQYFVSLADFKAISLNLLNSNLVLEALASTRFAPIEVADLITWSTITQTLRLFGNESVSLIIWKLNL